MDKALSNSAADIPDIFKTPLAVLYKALHERGVNRADFLECWERTGYSLSGSQLDRWVARLDTVGSAIKEDKKSGVPPLLDREQRDVVAGWVLHENETGKLVSLLSFYSFVWKYFLIKLSNGTISNYLAEDGFSCRLVKKKGRSYIVDFEALGVELWNWVFIQDFRARGIRRDKFACIDFTFTGHRTDRLTTFAPRGGEQPMVPERISDYTNCVVTVTWSDGINRTPPILFTYNSNFRLDRNPTKRRSDQEAHLRRCMDKYGITEDRVVYIGNQTKEMRKYARECPDLVRRFFTHYEVAPGCSIYSDEGNSFFDVGHSALLEVGFEKHSCFPAKVHQFLSPNDNCLHGTSKQAWRKSGVDFSDDVESCLALLAFMDRDINKYSRHWWDRNLILLTEEGVKDLIGESPMKLSQVHKSWKRSYEAFMNEYISVNK